jgi:1,2-diacylglycerol 3-beta-glucosyltransferase
VIDLTVANYFIAGVVLYYAALFLLARVRREAPSKGREQPFFVIVVPARNEELVIAETLANLCSLDYSDYRVLVMNDDSSDATRERAATFAATDQCVALVDRSGDEAGRGKSAVLNHAFRLVGKMIASGELPARRSESVVIGIVDADGRLEQQTLRAVAPYFGDPEVASVQVGVRIGNAAQNGLTRLQDMEFVGFTYLVQIARDHLGSSGLGGNGQFTRFSSLGSLGREPWAPRALTEDLDLGLSLVEKGWKTRFCSETFVTQQGVSRFRPLFRQRTRWIHGHYQCWAHIPRLIRSRNVRWATRFDLTTYLLLVVTVVVVTFNALASVASIAGLVIVDNRFLDFIPGGYERSIVAETFALLPLAIFMWTYQRNSERPFRWWELPAYGLAFTFYTYIWVFSTARAWMRIVLRRSNWTKTPRVAEPAS